ncbi:MAG TPA: flagellar assembly protein FliW [Acidimicrobiia bacterium]|nr:flagellar assembly protein FliW [Acidimicrobiia bacterium]
MTPEVMEPVETELPELHFASGLPGFPDVRRFVLVQLGDELSPFSVLRSLDEGAGPEFVVTHPGLFFPDYAPEIDDDTADRLELKSADDALLLVIVTVGDPVAASTANLLGPIVVNRHTRAAAQAVLGNSGYATSEALVSTS